jgi:RNA polymerase sigma-70 factor (ECF subfamily)
MASGRSTLKFECGASAASDIGRAVEWVMAEHVIPLPREDDEQIRRMTAGMYEGEERAFEEFYDSYYDRLFRYLLLLTRGNEELTRELIQVTMTKAMGRPRRFDTEGQLWNWVAAIARNAFIDSIRRTRRTPQIVSLLAEDNAEMACVLPDDADGELLAVLENCISALDGEERELIESFYFKDGSHRSVAEERGLTPKAVESRLARVRQKLRQAVLQKLHHEND